MKILVTGAAGLTGREVCRRFLLTRGDAVVAVVRHREQAHAVPGATVVVADCEDQQAMDRALAGCDALVHVAGIRLGPAVARLRRFGEVASVVVVSSAGVDSAHRESAALYRAGEEAIRAARPDAVLVRPTMIYGSERDRNVHRVIRFASRYRFLPVFNGGETFLQPIHYADLAAALVALVGASAPSPIYAGGAAPVTVRRAGELIFAALGLPPRFVRLPLAPALALTSVIDALVGSHWRERLERTHEDRSVDNAELVRLTGLRPRQLAEGVREEVTRLRRVGLIR